MPTGPAFCKCEICNKGFVQKCDGINCEAVENRIDWYSKHHTICPSCFGKIKRRESLLTMQKIEEMFPDLPVISGGTEGQILYANQLRSRFIEKYLILCFDIEEMVKTSKDRLLRIINKQEPQPFDTVYSIPEISCAIAVFRNGNASFLIDTIRNVSYL